MNEEEKTKQVRAVLFDVERKDDDPIELLRMFEICVQMADKVSARRQTANSYFLTMSTFLVGLVFGATGADLIDSLTAFFLSASGIAVSVMWSRSVKSYGDLNTGKFAVINELEKTMVARPFAAEWEYLERGESKDRYRPFRAIEIQIPRMFGLLFSGFCAVKAWDAIGGFFCA